MYLFIRDALLERIRQKKEVIGKLRCQAWSHFGSVVSSYFTFLRWIVFVNVIITFIIVAFVVLPEALADAAGDGGRRNRTESRKEIPMGERIHADELAVVWHYDLPYKYI
uniref:Transmembrane protein n=1 Tax=Heterorhabditis bacteriophora TaxID=37862 RepID=A0A1I7W9G5_HETBA